MVAHAEGCAITTGTEVVCAADDLTGFQTQSGAGSVTINAGVKLGNVDAEFGVVEGEEGLIFVGSGVIEVHDKIDGDLTNDGTISDNLDSFGVVTGQIVGKFVNNGSIIAPLDGVHLSTSAVPIFNSPFDDISNIRRASIVPAPDFPSLFSLVDQRLNLTSGALGTGLGIPTFLPELKFIETDPASEVLELIANVNEIENNGVIKAAIGTALAVGAVSGDIVNTSSGLISGGARGILAGHVAGSVLNNGIITSASSAIDLHTGLGNFRNTGDISGGVALDHTRFPDGVGFEYRSGADGVHIKNSLRGDFRNELGGLIVGSRDGVRIGGFVGSIANAGTIKGDGIGVFVGVGFLNSGQVTIGNAGDGGPSINEDNDFTNTESGIIEAGIGVQFEAVRSLDFVNAGAITGLKGAGVLVGEAEAKSTEIALADGQNSAPILVGSVGGSKQSPDVTGSISRSASSLGGGTPIINIPTSSPIVHYLENASTGLIQGQIGIEFTQQKRALVSNSGTITGTDGTAIKFSNKDDKLVFKTGSTINGTVDGGRSTDTLRIEGVVNEDDDFINFEILEFAGDADTRSVFDGDIAVNQITIESGTLIANGVLGREGSVLNIANGATLGGNGKTFADLTVVAGATLAPGASIGTQTVIGDFTTNPGSTLEIEVTDNAADLVDVTGNVIINGGTLNIVDLPGAASNDPTDVFVIINNDGNDAIQGPGFDTITDNLAFLDPSILTTGGDGNDLVLFFQPTGAIDLTTVGQTANQRAVGTSLNGVSSSTLTAKELLNAFVPLTFQQARAALNSLSGEGHAATQMAINSTGLFLGGAFADLVNAPSVGGQPSAATSTSAFNALSFAPTQTSEQIYAANFGLKHGEATAKNAEAYRASVTSLYRTVSIDGNGNGADTDITNAGVLASLSSAYLDGGLRGIAAGYLDSRVKTSSTSDVKIDTAMLGVFGKHSFGAFDVSGNLGYAYNAIESERFVRVGGFSNTAEADYSAHNLFGGFEIGHEMAMGSAVLRPFSSLGFSLSARDGFNETGAGAANLSAASQTDLLGRVSVGVSASTTVETENTVLVPRVAISFDQIVGDENPDATLAFQSGGPAFDVGATSSEKSRVRASAGFAAKIGENATGFAEYTGTFSRDTREHTGKIGFSLKF